MVASSHTFCDALSTRKEYSSRKTKSRVPQPPPSGDEALLAPEATSASAALRGFLFHTVTVCPLLKMLAASTRAQVSSSRQTEKSNFAHIYSFLHVSQHHVVLCGEFPASPFDDDLAKMDLAAGLVVEGCLGQPIEGERAVQDGMYPRLFERSDIILLLTPAANHESLQARLLGQQSDAWSTLHPAARGAARQPTRFGPLTRTSSLLMDCASVPGPPTFNDMIYAASREISHPLPQSGTWR